MTMDSGRVDERLFSIVTVCFNAAASLESTIKSLEAQECRDFEWIVIDGASTDGTRQILENHRHLISYLVSEKDSGIYDAMNKGVRAATGRWIFFLNADDTFADPRVLSDIENEVRQVSDNVSVVYGDVYYTDGAKKWLRSFEWLSAKNLLYGDLCHQAVFARRAAFEAVGLFDSTLRINADYEWLLRVFLSSSRTRHIQRPVAVFFRGGAHTKDRMSSERERRAVRRRFATLPRIVTGQFLLRVRLKVRKMMGQAT